MKNALPKKEKPTLESLLTDYQVITGKDLIQRHKVAEMQKVLLQEAIEFEERSQRIKINKLIS